MRVDAMTQGDFTVRQAHWAEESADLRAIRTAVFVMEQRVPESVEWDGLDPACFHVLALDSHGKAIGTGRLATDGKIGRMAVLKDRRGTGVGASILEFLIVAARNRGMDECYMNAQSHALAFYERHGFEARGESFLEADIPHHRMHLRL